MLSHSSSKRLQPLALACPCIRSGGTPVPYRWGDSDAPLGCCQPLHCSKHYGYCSIPRPR